MKKFMKRCAMIAFIFAVLGCVMGLIGSTIAGRGRVSQMLGDVTGGWWDWDMNTGNGIIEDLIDTIDSGVDYDISDASMFDSGQDIQNGNVDKYCPGEGISKLEIELGGCRLETRISEDDSIYLEAENAHKFQGYVKGDTLHIKSVTGSVTDWKDINKSRIVLYLPEQFWFDEVKLEIGAGEILFDDLYAEKAQLEAGAGRIAMNNVQVQDLELSIGAGSIELNDMTIEKLDAEVGMGAFLAEGYLDGDGDVECSMGNIDMTLGGSEEDFNYHLAGAMGNISLGEESYRGFSSEKKIDNHAGKEIELECSMGNISIQFKE